MKFTIYQESRPGRRPTNEDRIAYSYSRDSLLMVVADGMGGHLHGEVAAQIAVQYITESFQREAHPLLKDPFLFLSGALGNAHHAILDYAADRFLPEAPRTTCVACIVQDSIAYWAHAGDSRLYAIRGGRILAQTRDHSRVQRMIEDGLITAEAATPTTDPVLGPVIDRARMARSRRALNERYLGRLREELPLPTAELPFWFAPSIGPTQVTEMARLLGQEIGATR